MIVPMKKVSLVILNKDKKQSLEALKTVGVLHLETLEGKGEALQGFKEASNNCMTAISILGEIKLTKKEMLSPKSSSMTAGEVCQKVIALTEQKKKYFEEISQDNAELERLSLWGELDPKDFAFLKEKGTSLRLFEIPEDKYCLIDKELNTLLLNRVKKVARFFLINGGDERPASLRAEAFEVALPELSTRDLRNRIAIDNKEITKIDEELRKLAVYVPVIKAYEKSLQEDIEFETVYSGMGEDTEGKDTDLAWVSGYVPVDSLETLKNACRIRGWALAYSDPTEEDNVPTKLKNNKFVSLIYPLTDFLGTVPGYHEYDISGWFLLFFTVFFGMIFGDGGYGLLLTLIALVMLLKSAGKKGGSPLGGLMLLLGLATVAWGTVTCTWFGLKPNQLPRWLVGLSVPPISNAYASVPWLPFWSNDTSKGTLTTAQNLQIFCFTLAFLQLSVAHFKGMGRAICNKSLKFFGEFGSLLQLWGMFYVVLSMVVSSTIFSFDEIIYGVPIGTVSIGLVGFGFALSFIFSNYEGSLVESIMASVKGIISVLLGVVNVFSDIVSYIRLWAVGLAGAAISNTVNEMAGPLLGHAIMFVAFLALVCFGHGLNMVLNLLSVIVHGVRLNTLEFSTHLGMSWSGFKYNPFSEKEN